MNHFKITGWQMPTLAEASRNELFLMNELGDSQGAFSVEAHCQDLDVLEQVAEVAPTPRCACYCWMTLADGGELREDWFSLLHRAYLVFKNATVSINDLRELPAHDWDGKAPAWSTAVLTVLHSSPLKPGDKEPSPRTIELLSSLASKATGALSEPIKTSTSWTESGREHSYLLKVPREKAPELASEICSRFELRDGIGSFEFLGTRDRLAAIYQGRRFRFSNFPSTCWNLNYPADTVFSFGTSAFLFPVPNVQPAQLLLVASAIDRLGEKIRYHTVVKKYIAWKLFEDVFSPKVQGNYLLIAQQKSGGYAIFLGFERYDDKDPTAREFTSFAAPLLERMGAQLKIVSGPG
jgi:hypothetical protein